MKTLAAVIICSAFIFRLTAQTPAPVVISLTSYKGTLQSPARVATDSEGKIYVTDPRAGQVMMFDSFGRQTSVYPGIRQPLAIAVDSLGHIFVSDQGSGSVTAFDSHWVFLYKLGIGDGEFQLPNHVALARGTNDTSVYVADSLANKVKIYRGRTLIAEFGTVGAGPGQLDFPTGIAVSLAGELFVVDQNNDRVQVFDSAGTFLRGFNLGSSNPAGRSQGALLDNAGRLYVADAYQGTIKVFDSSSGVLLTSIGDFGESPGQLSSPGGVALDKFSRLCVASANNSRVELFGVDSFLHISANVPAGVVPTGRQLLLTAMSGISGPVSFQWFRNGQVLSDQTNAVLVFDNVGLTDSGSYTAVATSASGSVTSSIASLTIMAPPTIVRAPENRTVLCGNGVVFNVQADGTELAFQWFHNGLELVGNTGNSLELPNVEAPQAGEYSVRVSNLLGSITSPVALLTVLTPPSQMEILNGFMQPDNLFRLTLNVDPGYSYTLEASADFLSWQPLTRFANEFGLFEFTDAESTNFWNRFYRIRWEP